MSKLKFPFSFKHMDSHREYKVTLKPNGNPLIQSVESGEYYSGYNLDTIKQNIESGVWILIQEKDDVETSMTQSTYDKMFDRIELLESLLVDANKRITELEKQQTSKEFKSISEMTLEDWKQAKREHAVFVTSEGRETIIEDIDSDYIFFDLYVYRFTLDGYHSQEPETYRIVKRIR